MLRPCSSSVFCATGLLKETVSGGFFFFFFIFIYMCFLLFFLSYLGQVMFVLHMHSPLIPSAMKLFS